MIKEIIHLLIVEDEKSLADIIKKGLETENTEKAGFMVFTGMTRRDFCNCLMCKNMRYERCTCF